jgi:ectoine hydroxylase-related dioxygenase (phytanoyl-CoA dioxygenase family)
MVRGTMIAGVSLGAERRLHMSRCAREWFFSLPDSKASFSSDTTARWTEKACTCMFTANGAPHTRRTLDIALPSGSLYIFRPPTNDQWLHSIPKDERIREPRLSITLRNYRSTAEDMQHHLAERPVQPPLSPARLVAVEPPLFDVASELPAAQAYLREHGLVVFANVLSPDECTEAMRRFWDFCEACDKSISRRDSRTWTNAAWPSSLGTGIVSAYGIGSSDFMWYVRTRPALLALFERYWNTSRLLCSLDGCGVYRSAEHAFSPNRAWLHADVNLALLPPLPLDSPLPTVTHSVQGQVNLLPVTGTETGSFCWIDGSHRVYADEARQGKAAPESTLLGSNADKKGHYCLLPGNHPLAQQSVSIFGHLPAGSCVLWDSALVHANIAPTTFASDSSRAPLPPAAKRMRRDPEQPSLHRFFQQGPKAPSPPPQLRRLTAYVTMAPASNVAPDALAALGDNHVKAAVQGITTSHWPDVPWSVDARKRDAAPLAACRGRVFSPREEALLRGR